MANLKEVRNRIKSVISTQQITKAMKMVSAAKLRKAQQAIVQMRPYSTRLNSTLKKILNSTGGAGAANFGKATNQKKPLIVIFTSDRGLCGAFNTNILKLAAKYISDHYSAQAKSGELQFLCIGKKGFEFARRRFSNCRIMDEYVPLYASGSFDRIAELADYVMAEFKAEKFDQIELYYGRFKNAGTQFPEREQFLPVEKIVVGLENKPKTMRSDYIFEPVQEELLQELIPSILQAQLFKCLLDTQASEHGARMTAMDKATENAEAMLGELKINYNKARQEAITRELSEIVGGAAALEG